MENINLEFSENTLRILCLDERKKIISKEEVNLSFSLSDETVLRKNKSELIGEFDEIISEHLRKHFNNNKTVSAGILIGTEQTFLNVTPIDFNEDISSVSSHIIWELSNYYPDTYKDFNILYYRLNTNHLSENIDDALLVGINKKKLEFIKMLCDGSGIRIKNIEIDHIMIDKCIKELYSAELKNRTVLVTGIKKGRADFSIFVDGSLKYYDHVILSELNLIYVFVNQLNLFNSLLFNIEKIFIYGEDSNYELKTFLEEQFRDIPATNIKYDENTDDTVFSPLYGLALKNVIKQ